MVCQLTDENEIEKENLIIVVNHFVLCNVYIEQILKSTFETLAHAKHFYLTQH